MISRAELARLARAAELGAPAEACGLLLGTRERGRTRLRLLPTGVGAPNGFRIERALLESARRRGLPVCGCFHTHPTQGPEPSPLDLRSMARAPIWWLIYSRPRRAVRLLRIRRGRIERGTLRLG